jgi:putative transposase
MKSNEVWHINTTVIRLIDGSRAYLHAVIDNFSRRILSWTASATFDPATTAEILLTGSKVYAKLKGPESSSDVTSVRWLSCA